MNNISSYTRVIAILIYSVIVGIIILSLGIMESTLITSLITLILSFSIVIIYGVSRDIFPKFMVLIVGGANIATMIVTIVEIALIM